MVSEDDQKKLDILRSAFVDVKGKEISDLQEHTISSIVFILRDFADSMELISPLIGESTAFTFLQGIAKMREAMDINLMLVNNVMDSIHGMNNEDVLKEVDNILMENKT